MRRDKKYTQEFLDELRSKISVLKKGDVFTVDLDLDGCFVNGFIKCGIDCDNPVNETLYLMLQEMKRRVEDQGAIFHVNLCSTANLVSLNEVPRKKIVDKLCELNNGNPVVQLFCDKIYLFYKDASVKYVPLKNGHKRFYDDKGKVLMKSEVIKFYAEKMVLALHEKRKNPSVDLTERYVLSLARDNLDEVPDNFVDLKSQQLQNTCFVDNDQVIHDAVQKEIEGIVSCVTPSTMVDDKLKTVFYSDGDIEEFFDDSEVAKHIARLRACNKNVSGDLINQGIADYFCRYLSHKSAEGMEINPERNQVFLEERTVNLEEVIVQLKKFRPLRASAPEFVPGQSWVEEVGKEGELRDMGIS